MMEKNTTWPIMVLAHNEEKHILKCLESLEQEQVDNRELRIFVMANGCTDNTEEVVKNYARDKAHIKLISIELADKNNAWNTFVHAIVSEFCPGSDIYFFMDGDATIGHGSLAALDAGLATQNEANAASAIPLTGRSRLTDSEAILQNYGLVANLYALRGSFVHRLIENSVRLPLGLEGDDGLLGALIKWDLDPTSDWIDRRIVPCSDAGFAFVSMRLWSPSDWRAYWRRLIRYARRQYEFELLGPRLKKHGLSALPVHIAEVYADIDRCKIKWGGIKFLMSCMALREMKRAFNCHSFMATECAKENYKV